jgi:hypothetical protein
MNHLERSMLDRDTDIMEKALPGASRTQWAAFSNCTWQAKDIMLHNET